MMPMNTVVPIRDEEAGSSIKKKPLSLPFPTTSLLKKIVIEDHKKLSHSIKVGISLVFVSLLYLLQALYDQVGDNAMWAIMTVVVVFEFTVGGTLSKGLNRGIGTILGGGLGCGAAILAQRTGNNGSAVAIGISVFIFGSAATYLRLIPSIKKKFEYGAVIFILTFNLVAVSGFRGGEKIVNLAGDRLLTIGIGFIFCIFISMFVFPVWAGDELHQSLVSKFDKLALCIEECLEECFKQIEEKSETQARTDFNSCKSVLDSKSTDEALANFARWEPWHGRFGFSYPWSKYICIGDLLRELAASVLTMRASLQSHQQSSPDLKSNVKAPCEEISVVICSTLRELGKDIFNMRKFHQQEPIAKNLQTTLLELNSIMNIVLGTMVNENGINGDGFFIASFALMLMEMVKKVEILVKEVEELGDLAEFLSY